jgi:DNA helicase II / ATP-dependent DNA helicase PcrA
MILDGLNNEQKIAVLQEGNVLLTACPGSGKTKVIIHRLAYELINIENNSKKRIVALTFTKRASEEIFNRLNTMGIDLDKIWSGTLHAFCYEWIVKPYSCYLDELKNGYSIASESYCEDLLNEIKVKHGLKAFDSINMRFNRDGSYLEKNAQKIKVIAEYHNILNDSKLIDFEQLLYYSYKILDKYPKIPKTLSNIFQLICIDEFQDTQDLLYAIVSLIIKAGSQKCSLFLVGDTDQAIYQSLGGTAKTFEEIKNEIGNQPLKRLSLQGNYRSNQRIIDFYSHFQTEKIEINAIGKNAKKKGVITLNKTIDRADLLKEIARLIQLNLDKGIPEDEICVLVPQWWLITSISKKLRTMLPGVNFDASGLTPMSKNRENIWYKLSRLFLTEPHPRIYSTRYRWVSELIDGFKDLTGTDFVTEYSNERSILKLVNSIESAETEGINYLNECFDKFLLRVGINEKLYPQLLENRKIFFENIEKRLNDKEFNIPSDIQSFKSFYREMTGIVINTCVGIKGEEFETVITFGLLKGYIPHWNEIINEVAPGEAKKASQKLMYVICSRAKTNLHLISETGRKTKTGNDYVMNSELESIVFDYDNI